jgi:hypothetical protein
MSSQQVTFLDMLLDASNFLRSASLSPDMSKEELCKSIENRLSAMIARMVSSPMGGSFSIFNRESHNEALQDHS